ncbi:MAG: helix-turn-helix domain-containing protein [Fibrobacteria bacterium]
MLGNTYDGQICSAARALEIVGERWSLLILRNAIFGGMSRFSDFKRSLGISPNVLAKRLETFVQEGIMTNSKGPDSSGHLEYQLTDKGLGIMPVIIALREWGDRWEAPEGPPALLEHKGCGGRIVQRLHCKACESTPKMKEVVAKPTKAIAIYQLKTARKISTNGKRIQSRRNNLQSHSSFVTCALWLHFQQSVPQKEDIHGSRSSF